MIPAFFHRFALYSVSHLENGSGKAAILKVGLLVLFLLYNLGKNILLWFSPLEDPAIFLQPSHILLEKNMNQFSQNWKKVREVFQIGVLSTLFFIRRPREVVIQQIREKPSVQRPVFFTLPQGFTPRRQLAPQCYVPCPAPYGQDFFLHGLLSFVLLLAGAVLTARKVQTDPVLPPMPEEESVNYEYVKPSAPPFPVSRWAMVRKFLKRILLKLRRSF